MKWFHHECTAKHDSKLQILGEAFGAEGIGVYWGLLEEIGHHSDSFHIKVTGVSAESDQAYVDTLPAGANIPRIPLKILGRLLFTSRKKTQSVIEKSVEVGLFDQAKWRKYGLLYSPAFEHRADDYTRRRRRTSENVRTHSEHPPAKVGPEPESAQQTDDTSPDNVPPEQNTEQKEIQKERQKQKEKENRKEMLCSVPALFELPTVCPQPRVHESHDDAVLVPSAECFTESSKKFRKAIRKWNEQERSTVDWIPTDDELKKLFYGGDASHKLWLCRQATNLTGGTPDFPRLVLRALTLMLEASTKQRIQNPFGWIWSCIHGTPEGMPPWVHLPTALEETRRIGSPRSPP